LSGKVILVQEAFPYERVLEKRSPFSLHRISRAGWNCLLASNVRDCYFGAMESKSLHGVLPRYPRTSPRRGADPLHTSYQSCWFFASSDPHPFACPDLSPPPPISLVRPPFFEGSHERLGLRTDPAHCFAFRFRLLRTSLCTQNMAAL